MNEIQTTLEDMLYARERRIEKIRWLSNEYKSSILVAKLNIPGPEKDNSLYRLGLSECKKALLNGLLEYENKILYEDLNYYETGAELYMAIDMEGKDLKRMAMDIEETHSLGRLFDIDVQDSFGGTVSRSVFGKGLRKCLVCDEDAFVCARSRAHDLDTIVSQIQRMLLHVFDEQ